jgi:rRNA maturation endonuclease Nob1
MSELYYLQDNRSYVGNDILFWAKDGKGYTTDLSSAEIYTKDKALSQHRCRETDIPWPKDYIDSRTRPAVDMQYVDIKTALDGTGIELTKPEKYRKPTYRCYGCGVFMTEEKHYTAPCSKCGCDNRP